ncbi:MAG: nickel-responsive transcriptional regulator NikR [Candidatus Omnitrophica bacterium]|nr:nickel-responsive transcriptional regulator NikR [Candidatus Omnitrophota bacterium]
MPSIVRFGISLEQELLEQFDKRLARKGYGSRSEALRDLIREDLIKEEWDNEESETAGAIIFIYDHHQRQLLEKVTEIQHNHQDLIISTSHIHLDHHNCLEIIAVRGRGKKIKQLADGLRSLKGVKHGRLSLSTTGKGIR